MFSSSSQLTNSIFDSNLSNFDEICCNLFGFQYQNNEIYRKYCNYIGVFEPNIINNIEKIPFLPISFFKTQKVLSSTQPIQKVFSSSATGGMGQSKHYITDLNIYIKSFVSGFERVFGKTENFCFMALLPSYLDREGSSLIYMVQHLMNLSKHPLNGFFLYEHKTLSERMEQLERMNQPYILFGVSFALLDFIANARVEMKIGKIIETGGMKGRKKELTKMEVQNRLREALKTDFIYSEYGMTELLSQAYAFNDGMYDCPPWMRILISDPNDPFSILEANKTGLINVIDLANINSCSFIQTADLGRKNDSGKFEVLGRMDNSELRGCSLMIS
ncbi:MAG: acyl transferase [Bacteroidota bacterium]|nr:acyl transferase [Bacteroidota bacterium]